MRAIKRKEWLQADQQKKEIMCKHILGIFAYADNFDTDAKEHWPIIKSNVSVLSNRERKGSNCLYCAHHIFDGPYYI